MPRVYGRKQGSNGTIRCYADLRDIGVGQHALSPSGSNRATADPAEAEILKGRLIERLRAEPQEVPPESLKAAGEKLLQDKPKGKEKRWVVEMRRCLDRAEGFFGADRPLDAIKAKHIR